MTMFFLNYYDLSNTVCNYRESQHLTLLEGV